MHVVRLAQAGVPVRRRFSFYDQIHTTGMDIHQCIDAKAAITLGKDMTFRGKQVCTKSIICFYPNSTDSDGTLFTFSLSLRLCTRSI